MTGQEHSHTHTALDCGKALQAFLDSSPCHNALHCPACMSTVAGLVPSVESQAWDDLCPPVKRSKLACSLQAWHAAQTDAIQQPCRQKLHHSLIPCMARAGRLKEKSYDPYTGVSTLQAAWVSKASERQRRGRAGRCQPGVAFHCYSRTRSQALADVQLPELKRSPLDELCLQVSYSCCCALNSVACALRDPVVISEACPKLTT